MIISKNQIDLLKWDYSKIAETYFHANCSHKEISGSGFANNLCLAKKIAFSEFCERSFVLNLLNSKMQDDPWDIKFDSSASGFAVGYNLKNTVKRSLCEAVERWVLSKWVDEKFEIKILNSDSLTKKLQIFSKEYYLKYDLYHREQMLYLNNEVLKIHVVVFLGWQKSGVFVGYGSKFTLQDSINHAFIESLRNYTIFKNQIKRDYFPYDRIHFFGENPQVASDFLNLEKTQKWPNPNLKCIHHQKFDNMYISRTIFEGLKPWQLGKQDRFLY